MDLRHRKKLASSVQVYMIAVLAVFLFLGGRLAWMQLIDRGDYATRAEENRMRIIPIRAKRGNIYSSDGTLLVTDYPSYEVAISYSGLSMEESEASYELLAQLLNDGEITAQTIRDKVSEQVGRLYEPVVIKRGITAETLTKIENNREKLPDVQIYPAPRREYIYDSLAGHLLGFIGEITGEELEREEFSDYKAGQNIGQVGVEREYDSELQGEDGYRQVEVNARNRPIRDIKTVPPAPGNSIVLTLDLELQQKMEDSFDRLLETIRQDPESMNAEGGAAVLLEAKTGRVLAMTTRPDDRVRVQNKVIQGRYIPGSTFKMVTGLAALEAETITPAETISCTGKYWRKPYISCIGVHGNETYTEALRDSCNTYFQELGYRTGIDNISEMGKKLGLDSPTGIDLPYESSGTYALQGLPTVEKREEFFTWSANITNKRYERKIEELRDKYAGLVEEASTAEEKENLETEMNREIKRTEAQWKIDLNWNTTWHAADTFNVAIGQGRQNYTPLQLACYVAAIADRGVLYTPYVVDRIIDSEGTPIQEFHPSVRAVADIDAADLELTVEGMEMVAAPGGTAGYLFYDFPEEISVAAKTGTAQNEKTVTYTDNEGNDVTTTVKVNNGLFVAFAPSDNPEIVFAGVVEQGESGGGTAGRIARDLFIEYFGLAENVPESQTSDS